MGMQRLVTRLKYEWDLGAEKNYEGTYATKIEGSNEEMYNDLRNAHNEGDFEAAHKHRTTILTDFLGGKDSAVAKYYAPMIARMLDPVPENRPDQDSVLGLLQEVSKM